MPTTNRDFWFEKLTANVQRDQANTKALEDAGWTVIRVWEHEDPAAACQRILLARRPQLPLGHTPS
jgi:DNA mismatch endonuclease (patch repair protein)